VFPCQEEKSTGLKKKGFIDVFTIVTDNVFLLLEPDHKVKNVARLVAWATLPSLEQIKRHVDRPDSVTFIWRNIDDRRQWVLSLQMQNANECISMIVKHLKRQGLVVNKGYEKKHKILESEVSANAVKELKIGAVLERIAKFEEDLKTIPTGEVVQQLINLYNKAIEYYSALNDEKHMVYLKKL
jgi:hypothetical protein